MAVNKLVKELPIKNTLVSSDRFLIDDGITKTAFLSSLNTFLVDSDSQTLTFNGQYLTISNGNTIPLSGFTTINTTTKLLSAGTDLMSLFKTSDSDNQTLSYNDNRLSVTSGNTVTLTAFGLITIDKINNHVILSNVPTVSTGLPNGALYNNNGQIQIVY